MPKIVTKEEREKMQDALYTHTIRLIKKKGMKKITVEDIIQSVGIAKGTFYSYYPSKEELLFNTLLKSEEKLFQVILTLDFSTGAFRETITKALKEIYLSKESIVLYLSPEDITSLISKIPSKKREVFQQKQANNFERIAELLEINKEDEHTFGTVSYLMDCLHFTASNPSDYGNDTRQKTLEILIQALADFLTTIKNTKGVPYEKSNN